MNHKNDNMVEKSCEDTLFLNFTMQTIHCVRKSAESRQMEEAASVLTAFILSTHPWPRWSRSRAAADSECREKEAGRATGYEDVHGNADVNMAAARRSDDGGGWSGKGWQQGQCGRAGWLVSERGGLQCHPVLVLSVVFWVGFRFVKLI